MKPNLISVFEMRSWPAVWAPQDFLPLLSSPCSPAPETSAEFPMAGCLILMASSQICFPFTELACDAAFHSTFPGCHNLWCCLKQWWKDEFTLIKNFFTWGDQGPLNGSLKCSEGACRYSILHALGKGATCSMVLRMGQDSPCRKQFMWDTQPESDSYLSMVPVLQE